jgi:hypothetical protein
VARRIEDDTDELVGQDSFLDVVTNIVGILILLVMVTGMRASQAGASSAARGHASAEAAAAAEVEVQSANEAALNAERDARELIRRAITSHGEAEARDQERTFLSTALAEAEKELAERRARLSAEDQVDFDLRRKLTEAQLGLDELTRKQMALLPDDSSTEQIECEPTPIARTVTGREVHVLLADRHLAIVPFDELLTIMKEDARANVWRLKQEDKLERTVGPVDDFKLKYVFIKSAIVARNDAGSVMTGQVVRFDRCYFLPLTTPAGWPAEESLQSGSEFQQYLRNQRPGVTITVWTYPGNYDQLREVKRFIRELGLVVAVRPLPPGMPIGASSGGSETVTD